MKKLTEGLVEIDGIVYYDAIYGHLPLDFGITRINGIDEFNPDYKIGALYLDKFSPVEEAQTNILSIATEAEELPKGVDRFNMDNWFYCRASDIYNTIMKQEKMVFKYIHKRRMKIVHHLFRYLGPAGYEYNVPTWVYFPRLSEMFLNLHSEHIQFSDMSQNNILSQFAI